MNWEKITHFSPCSLLFFRPAPHPLLNLLSYYYLSSRGGRAAPPCYKAFPIYKIGVPSHFLRGQKPPKKGQTLHGTAYAFGMAVAYLLPKGVMGFGYCQHTHPRSIKPKGLMLLRPWCRTVGASPRQVDGFLYAPASPPLFRNIWRA